MMEQKQKLAVFSIFLVINLTIVYYIVNLNHKIDLCAGRVQLQSELIAQYEKTVESRLNEIKASIQGSIKELQNSFEQTIKKQDAVQEAVKAAPVNPKLKYDTSHFTQDGQFSAGPIQDDEGLCLYGLVKALRAKTIVEFGFAFGHSSFNFLKALDQDAKLFSYDIILHNANADSLKDPRFKLYLKSQTEFTPADIDNRTIDIAYMDAGHTLEIQTIAFEKIIRQMSPFGVVVVHDTGLHLGDSADCACDFGKYCGHMHQKDERVFINWVLEKHQDWQVINIHSFQVWRHGLTFMQRKFNLSVETLNSTNCRIP